jgi:hypothetical protein
LTWKTKRLPTVESHSLAQQALGLILAVGVVVIVAWEPIVYRLGAENLSANRPLAMGVAMFAVTLSERVSRKGISGSGWADVAHSIAIGAGIGAILTLL